MRVVSYGSLILLLLGLTITSNRQLQVPVIKQPTQREIKLGRLQQVKQPQYNFKYVQSRQVFKADAEMSPFTPCHQNKPQVSFSVTDRMNFDAHPYKPIVLYKFEDVQYSQYLLDAYIDENNTVYMIFEDGKAATVNIDGNKNTRDQKLFNISRLEPDTKLEPGYFVQIGADVVFINNKFAIVVSEGSGYRLDGYQGGVNFITAISVDSLYVAVAYEEFGVVFYWLTTSDQKLEQFAYLPPSQISTKGVIQIADLAYHAKQKSLLILDEDQGILSFTLQKLADKQIRISPGSVLFKREACSMMNLKQKTLHVVCNDVYQVSLQSWPRIEEKVLPHPNLKVRQIYVQGPLVAFVGRNIFKLMYLGRLVNYFEDQKMDKLIFKKDLFISANEGGLLIGRYDIIEPYITCQTVYDEMVGSHPLIFKTFAECSPEFFESYDIKLNTLNSFTDEDTCVYTVERTLYFWKTGQIMLLPIIIVLVLLLVIALGVFLIWMLKRFSINKFQKQLEQYTSLTTVDNQKHQQLVEQQPQSSGNNKSGASNNLQNEDEDPDKNREQKNANDKEMEVQMQNHDIQ